MKIYSLYNIYSNLRPKYLRRGFCTSVHLMTVSALQTLHFHPIRDQTAQLISGVPEMHPIQH